METAVWQQGAFCSFCGPPFGRLKSKSGFSRGCALQFGKLWVIAEMLPKVWIQADSLPQFIDIPSKITTF
ncbi:hypothetical protein [Oceanobacillus massiliensis]|uniref:hypothetical protein n=1 Tax=Oceanobacillus massiliensis TaxID=1465765 RepID=UPI0030197286